MNNTGEAEKKAEDGAEGEEPKQLSSHEIFMRRLAAMGALDENSAPPCGNNAPPKKKKRTPTRKKPTQKPNPQPKPDPPAPQQMTEKKTSSPNGGKSKAQLLAEKKARFEAKMKKRAEERRKAAELKQQQEQGNGDSERRSPKPQRQPAAEAPDEEPMSAGPSSTELLMKRLEKMGALDEGSAPPPSKGGIAPSKPRSLRASPKAKSMAPPGSPAQSMPEPVEQPPADEGQVPDEKGLTGTEILMRKLAAMGGMDESSVPPRAPSASSMRAPSASSVSSRDRKSVGSSKGKLARIRARSPRSSRAPNPEVEGGLAPPGADEGASGTDMLMKRLAKMDKGSESGGGKPRLSVSSTDKLKARLARMEGGSRPSSRSSGRPGSGRPGSKGSVASRSDRIRQRLAAMKGPPGGPDTRRAESPRYPGEEPLTPRLPGDDEKSEFEMPPVDDGAEPMEGPGEAIDTGELSLEELRAQMEAEHEILNLEVLETREELEGERMKIVQLDEVLQRTMAEFDESMQASNLRRADDVARIGLQETELKQLRDKTTKHEHEIKILKKTNQELEANTALLTESERELSQQLDSTKKDLSRSQELFEQLKKHAESKLQNAAKLYADMQKLAEQKLAESQNLASERDQLRQKIGHLEKQLNTAQQNILMMEERSAQLGKQLGELQQSTSNYKQQWFEANNGFQQAKQQNNELLAINERYRVNITQLNDRLRQMEADAKEFRNVQDEIRQLNNANQELQEANRALKSRIFDAMETEKQNQKRIHALRAGGAGGPADDQIADLQDEIKKLKNNMRELKVEKEQKEKENKELVNICDDLLNKLEIARSEVGAQ
ncbi:hypothetical protein AAMO2058_001302400 [Amorphochlora amoebiformis]|mmetsp:Transcript_7678/g.11911  ORF Transcript_7678/g.11911 Transcript_7678/m.11911 type:complete len:835 (-) Transcript_7678:157-2661(-)